MTKDTTQKIKIATLSTVKLTVIEFEVVYEKACELGFDFDSKGSNSQKYKRKVVKRMMRAAGELSVALGVPMSDNANYV